MPGRTMRAEDDVELLERPFVIQRRANASGDGFLAGIEMDEIAEAAVAQLFVGQSALEPSDAQDGRIHVDQFFIGQILCPIADFAIGPSDLATHRYCRACSGESLQK